MEHIRQFDWCNHTNYSPYFIEEKDLDNCVTEQILRGKFVDPLFSSDSDDGTQNVNWAELIANKRKLSLSKASNNNRNAEKKLFVAGLRPVPQYPKLSILTPQQHFQILKVLMFESHNGANSYPIPSQADKDAAKDLKEIYEQEQKEYIQWAKTMWVTGHNIRALRPLPPIESVYNAYFKVHLNAISSIPKEYEMVAQLNLQSEVGAEYEFVHNKDLLQVELEQVPQIICPNLNRMFTVYRHAPALPTVCPKHPCRFVLPTEKTVSSLPMSEIQDELAHYAAENGGQYIVSEKAMQCLVQHNLTWMLLVSVRRVPTKDGTTKNVIVINNEIYNKKEPARLRTKYALGLMLENALIPLNEKQRCQKTNIETEVPVNSKNMEVEQIETISLSSEDEEENLVIDIEESLDSNKDTTDALNSQADCGKKVTNPKDTNKDSETNKDTRIPIDQINFNGMLTCNCKGTIFEKPKRSYKHWKLTNKTRNEDLNIIIHCEHRTRGPHQELVLEAIPEYQLELGGAGRSGHAARALVLSLLLRRAASVYSVRLDPTNGHVVDYKYMSIDDLQETSGLNLVVETANMLHTTLNQLQGLLPGDYLLQHEIRHSANALLYVARSQLSDGHRLVLDVNNVELSDEQEQANLVTPATLEPVVLPYHRHRRLLPLAFSPYPNQIQKQTKKPSPEKKPAASVAKKKPKKKKKKKTNSSRIINFFE